LRQYLAIINVNYC